VDNKTYALDELAKRSGLKARTVKGAADRGCLVFIWAGNRREATEEALWRYIDKSFSAPHLIGQLNDRFTSLGLEFREKAQIEDMMQRAKLEAYITESPRFKDVVRELREEFNKKG